MKAGFADQKKKWREEGWSEVLGTKPVFLNKNKKEKCMRQYIHRFTYCKMNLGERGIGGVTVGGPIIIIVIPGVGLNSVSNSTVGTDPVVVGPTGKRRGNRKLVKTEPSKPTMLLLFLKMC